MAHVLRFNKAHGLWCDMSVDYLLACMVKKPLYLRADEGLSMEKGRCPKIRPESIVQKCNIRVCGTITGQQRELCNLETRLLELQRKINRLMCMDTICNDVLQHNRVEARNLWNKIKALLIRRYPQSMPSSWLSRALPNIHDITCMLKWFRHRLKSNLSK